MTQSEARDEILTMFRDAWLASLDSKDIPVRFDDVAADGPIGGQPWARAVVRNSSADQATLSNQNGQRRFERRGFLNVQIFTVYGDGLNLADKLSKVVQDAFEGKSSPSQIWFRSVRVNEIGQDGPYFQTNVVANFEYDEVK